MIVKHGKFISQLCVKLLLLVLFFSAVIFWLPPLIGDTLVPMYYSLFPKQCFITTNEIVIEGDLINPGNNCQTGTSVWMAAHNGKLYFHPVWCANVSNRTAYYQYLSVFDHGTAKRLAKMEDGIIGLQNSCVIYRSFSDQTGSADEEIRCYSIPDGKSMTILSTGADSFFSSDGTLHLCTSEYCYAIQNGSANPTPHKKNSYIVNDQMYTIVGNFYSESIVMTDAEGNALDLSEVIPEGRKSILPCNNGLLVHNEGQGDLLYLIRESDNEVVELFSVPCIKSISAVNTHDNFAYISFSRYQYDEVFDSMVLFENDNVSGTYRINLDDYSVQKINDSVYTGLYIFDDSGIYACDENCCIYKLDFDGNLIDSLLY